MKQNKEKWKIPGLSETLHFSTHKTFIYPMVQYLRVLPREKKSNLLIRWQSHLSPVCRFPLSSAGWLQSCFYLKLGLAFICRKTGRYSSEVFLTLRYYHTFSTVLLPHCSHAGNFFGSYGASNCFIIAVPLLDCPVCFSILHKKLVCMLRKILTELWKYI